MKNGIVGSIIAHRSDHQLYRKLLLYVVNCRAEKHLTGDREKKIQDR